MCFDHQNNQVIHLLIASLKPIYSNLKHTLIIHSPFGWVFWWLAGLAAHWLPSLHHNWYGPFISAPAHAFVQWPCCWRWCQPLWQELCAYQNNMSLCFCDVLVLFPVFDWDVAHQFKPARLFVCHCTVTVLSYCSLSDQCWTALFCTGFANCRSLVRDISGSAGSSPAFFFIF